MGGAYGLRSLMHVVRAMEEKQEMVEEYVGEMGESYAGSMRSMQGELLALREQLRGAEERVTEMQSRMAEEVREEVIWHGELFCV